MNDTPKPASFEDFKKSFSYGSRTDLNFKFLAKLSDDQAAKFFQDLLWKVGDAFDDGNFARIVEHVCEWQKRAYFSADKKFNPMVAQTMWKLKDNLIHGYSPD